MNQQETICCISHCQQKGQYLLMNVEGNFSIKGELSGTYPNEWKLCFDHFHNALDQMICCFQNCSKKVCQFSLNQMNQTEFEKLKINENEIKQNTKHRFICSDHFNKILQNEYFPLEQSLKRKGNDENQLPSGKRMIDENGIVRNVSDDSDTITDDLNENENNNLINNQYYQQFDNYNNNYNYNQQYDRNPYQNQFKQQEMNEIKELKDIKEQLEMKEMKSKRNKQEKCCFSHCNEYSIDYLQFLQPLQIPICQMHKKIITKLMRKSILDHQLVLPTESLQHLQQCDEIPYHPLAHYNKSTNDGRCGICFGYNNKKPIYVCSSCHFVFCAECHKILTEVTNIPFLQPSSHWRCTLCSNGLLPTQRQILLKKEVELIEKVSTKRLQIFMKKEGKQLEEKMNNERERRLEQNDRNRKEIKKVVQWFATLFPKAIDLRWKKRDWNCEKNIINGENLNEIKNCYFIFSKTQTNYYLCPQQPHGETLVEMLHSLALINAHRVIKEISSNVSDEIIQLGHSEEYVKILKECHDTKGKLVNWSIKYQLNAILSDQLYKYSNFSLSEMFLRVSLELTQAVCEGINIVKENENIKIVYIFTGTRGGVIPFDGVLERNENSSTNENTIVIKLTPENQKELSDDQNKKLVMLMKKKPFELPNGIQLKQTNIPISSTYFLNYTAIGIQYALKTLQYQRIGIIVLGDKELEKGVLQINDKDIENKQVLYLHYQNNSDETNNWNEIETQLKEFQPQLIFVNFHCEISIGDNLINLETFASQLCQFTYKECPFKCQIITLFQHGIIQDVFYDNYRSAIKLFIQSFNSKLQK